MVLLSTSTTQAQERLQTVLLKLVPHARLLKVLLVLHILETCLVRLHLSSLLAEVKYLRCPTSFFLFAESSWVPGFIFLLRFVVALIDSNFLIQLHSLLDKVPPDSSSSLIA